MWIHIADMLWWWELKRQHSSKKLCSLCNDMRKESWCCIRWFGRAGCHFNTFWCWSFRGMGICWLFKLAITCNSFCFKLNQDESLQYYYSTATNGASTNQSNWASSHNIFVVFWTSKALHWSAVVLLINDMTSNVDKRKEPSILVVTWPTIT